MLVEWVTEPARMNVTRLIASLGPTVAVPLFPMVMSVGALTSVGRDAGWPDPSFLYR